jgi:catechol 2,3-dioxygenase-like lactoylglutathione lyase family enzyme
MPDQQPSMLVELDVSDLEASVAFYRLLGFTVAVDRPQRRFAYLTLDGTVDLMLQASEGPGERLRTAALEQPFGRGVCIVIPCPNVDELHSTFVADGGTTVTELHERRYVIDVLRPTRRWRREGSRRVLNRQFVLADPDGYLLRFVTEMTE